jgi:hypothetical protein
MPILSLVREDTCKLHMHGNDKEIYCIVMDDGRDEQQSSAVQLI